MFSYELEGMESNNNSNSNNDQLSNVEIIFQDFLYMISR